MSFLTASSAKTATANRSYWSTSLGLDPLSITTARQVHGVAVAVVSAADRGRGSHRHEDGLPDVDALITDEPGVALMVVAADCVPLLLFDPVRHAAGAVHAGWRGTVAGMGARVVEAMHTAFGTDPADLIVGVGPSIGPCCYEVGAEVVDAWKRLGLDVDQRAVRPRSPRNHLDLWLANELALTGAGVRADRIERSGVCTRCRSDRYFSRRAGIGHRGLFGAVIALEAPQR